MSSPRVSILIPVYNRKKYIAECIQSALDQTFTDHEIVVVDNASDDGTWEICQQFAALNPRVRVLRNVENIGPVRNWMRCAQQARGEYSKILFSDDLLEPNCIERMLVPLENPEVSLVSCAARVGQEKKNSKILYSATENSLIRKEKYLSLLLGHHVPFSPGAVFLRTKDLVNHLHDQFQTSTPRPFDRHGAGPDVMIMLLTSENYPKVMCIREPLVFFRIHNDSFTISNLNNEISLGYVSAISYFLYKNKKKYFFLKFVVDSWLSSMIQQKHWINLGLYLKINEGRGSFFEIFCGFLLLPFLLLLKISRRTIRRSKV